MLKKCQKRGGGDISVYVNQNANWLQPPGAWKVARAALSIPKFGLFSCNISLKVEILELKLEVVKYAVLIDTSKMILFFLSFKTKNLVSPEMFNIYLNFYI